MPETMQQIACDASKYASSNDNFECPGKTKVAMAWRLATATLKWGQRPGEGDKAFVQA
ncbi:hypothetical protein RLEG12_32085 [Rhizobium leguminosarum bv. trifolii CB782]|nr:hypothetical protein RLEG12_32085 [Rhizobium leguminosarum bv. trifolii CB782]